MQLGEKLDHGDFQEHCHQKGQISTENHKDSER